MDRQIGELKYRIFWIIGTIVSFLFYFSGTVGLYIFFRKKVLRRYRNIVLTYHRIRDDDKEPDISVSTENFKRQISYLKNHFNVISLNDIVDNLSNQPNTSIDNIAITFDDGYKDNFLNAFPILKNYKLPAIIFLVSGQIAKREDMLNMNEIEIMKNNGIVFGSHTVNHVILTKVDIDTAAKEIFNSKQELENLLNEKVEFFAYPRGKKNNFNEQIKALVKKAGYKAAFTTENGEVNNRSNLFELKRIGIRNCSLFAFKTRVSGIFESRLFYFFRNLIRLT